MPKAPTTIRVDLDTVGGTPFPVTSAFDLEYERASGRRSAERHANWMRRTHIHGVEREIVDNILKSLSPGAERKAYLDHIKQVYVDSCYAACMPVPIGDVPRQSTVLQLENGKFKRAARKPEYATSEQRWVVNRDTFLREQAERYGHCPWSPDSVNATQRGPDRFHERGYKWPGSDAFQGDTGLINGKYFQNAFIELEPRTGLHPIFYRFVAGTARPSKGALAGPHKDDRRRYRYKRALLDCVYITAGKIIEWIRVDIDEEFASIETLEEELQAKVDAGVLPSMPNVISWIYDDRKPGVVINPHFIWLLPACRGVFFPKGEKREELKRQGKPTGERQYRLYKAVAEALHVACQSIGADMGGVENPADIKNPISPHCAVSIPNDREFLSLSELAELLDVRIDAEAIARQAARREMLAAGITEANSQRFFIWARRAGLQIAQDLYLSREPHWDPNSTLFEHQHFKAEIAEQLTASVPKSIGPRNSGEREALKKAIEMRAEYLSIHFDPAAFDRAPRDRGAAQHLIPEGADLKMRQDIGREYAHGSQVMNTQHAITEAYKHALRNGLSTTHKAIADLAGRCKNTVGAHAKVCQARARTELAQEAALAAVEPIKEAPALVPVIQTTDPVESSHEFGLIHEDQAVDHHDPIWCREGVALDTVKPITLRTSLNADTADTHAPASIPDLKLEPDSVEMAAQEPEETWTVQVCPEIGWVFGQPARSPWESRGMVGPKRSQPDDGVGCPKRAWESQIGCPELQWRFGQCRTHPEHQYRDVIAELMEELLPRAETLDADLSAADTL